MTHIESVGASGYSVHTVIFAVIVFRRQVGSAERETMGKIDHLILQNIKHSLPLYNILLSWNLYVLSKPGLLFHLLYFTIIHLSFAKLFFKDVNETSWCDSQICY